MSARRKEQGGRQRTRGTSKGMVMLSSPTRGMSINSSTFSRRRRRITRSLCLV